MTGRTSKLELKINKIEDGLKLSVQLAEDKKGLNILDRMKYHNVPNVSVAIFDEDSIEAQVYNLSDDEKITDKTLIQAGSISKPIAAAIVLKLVDEKKLNLDEDVNKIFERHGSDYRVPYNEKTKKEKVTLRRLLSHTAGLTVPWFAGYSTEEKNIPTLDQIQTCLLRTKNSNDLVEKNISYEKSSINTSQSFPAK